MKVKAAILALALAFGAATTAQAQVATPKVNQKQKTQQVRIAHGVANGSLSRAEAKVLRKQQRHINRVERRAKADGVVTGKERAVLNRKQRNASRQIRKQKKD
jgi:hypothetical protein